MPDENLEKQIEEIGQEKFSKDYIEAARDLFAMFHSLNIGDTKSVKTYTEYLENIPIEWKKFVITRAE